MGGLRVVCVPVGGEVTPRAEPHTDDAAVYLTLEDRAVIKLRPSYFRWVSVLQLM